MAHCPHRNLFLFGAIGVVVLSLLALSGLPASDRTLAVLALAGLGGVFAVGLLAGGTGILIDPGTKAPSAWRRTTTEHELARRRLDQTAHKLRSHLSLVQHHVCFLRDGVAGELSSEQIEYLDIASRNVERLEKRVEDLLALAQGDPGDAEPWSSSVPELVEEVLCRLRPAAEQKRQVLTQRLAHDLPQVQAEPEALRALLDHLVENAIVFTPEGGTITVFAYLHDREPGHLCIEVADSGPGVPAAERKRIFDPPAAEAVCVRERGLDLGLNLCRDQVEHLGGRIWVEGAGGQGSRFFLSLPAAWNGWATG